MAQSFASGTRSITSSDQKKLFQNFHIFEFRTGTSREGNPNLGKKNTYKHISVAEKCNITLNFPCLDIPHSNFIKAGISK